MRTGRRLSFLPGLPVFLLLCCACWNASAAAGEQAGVSPLPGGETRVELAPNDVPLVEIAGANEKGLSRNLYERFDVDERGLVLNNSAGITRSELGGFIRGNPNLRGGEADLILNEVVSSDPSRLGGYLEVAGRRADVVVANPYGISCDGCGFINTHRATLAAGVPEIGSAGTLEGFRIDNGAVTFEGWGINADNTSRFDVLARAIRVNAEVHARELNLVTGRGDVDYATLEFEATETDTGGAPEFAIGSGALGGIYGDRIRLVGTEAGLGVRLEGPVVARTGDLEISAEGRIHHSGGMAAARDLVLDGGEITAGHAALAGRRAELNAHRIDMEDDVLRAGEAVLTAGELHVSHEARIVTTREDTGSRESSGALHIDVDEFTGDGEIFTEGDARISAVERLANRGTLAALGNMELDTGRLTNDGDLAGLESLWISAGELENRNNSLMLSGGEARLAVQHLLNHGEILSLHGMDITGPEAQALSGEGEGEGEEGGALAETVHNRSGLIATEDGDLRIAAREVRNELREEPSYEINRVEQRQHHPSEKDEDCFNRNHDSGCKDDTWRYTESVDEVVNLEHEDPGRIRVGKDLTVSGEKLVNESGVIKAAGDFEARVDHFTNRSHEVTLHKEVRRDVSWRDSESDGSFSEKKATYSTAFGDPACSRSDVYCSNTRYYYDFYLKIWRPYREVPKRHEDAYTRESPFTETLVEGRVETGGTFRFDGDLFSNGVILKELETGSGEEGDEQDPVFRLDPFDDTVFASPGEHGLFRYSDDPGHPYLVETNPFLADLLGFTDDLHMLERLGWQPEGDLIRLGDDYHEMTLVARALAGEDEELRGGDYESRKQRYTELVENGIHAAEELELSIGVSLTPEQINALTEDMVWMEERDVAGREVMVPVVYLASGTVLDTHGGTIAAGHIDVDADEFANSGRMHADGHLRIDGEDRLLNAGVIEAGQRARLYSGADLDNRSGLIRGNEVYLGAAGDLISETVTETLEGDRYWFSRRGDIARIEGGNIRLESDGDMRLTATEIEGDRVAIHSDGDLDLGAAMMSRGGTLGNRKRGRGAEHTHALTTSVLASLDILLSAEDNLSAVAASLETGQGDISLLAGGDLEFDALLERDFIRTRNYSSGSLGRSRTSERMNDEQRVVASSLSAGGDLLVNARRDGRGNLVAHAPASGDVRFTSASLQAGGDAMIASGGELLFDSAAWLTRSEYSYERDGVTSSRVKQDSESRMEYQTGLVSAGGNLFLQSLDNTVLFNTDLEAGNDLRMTAGAWRGEDGHWHFNPDAGIGLLDVHDIDERERFRHSEKMDLTGATLALATGGVAGSSLLGAGNPGAAFSSMRSAISAADQARRGSIKESGEDAELSRGSRIQADGNLHVQALNSVALRGSDIAGLRDDGSTDAGTHVEAGGLRISGMRVTNDDPKARIVLDPGEDSFSSHSHEEDYKPDYKGLASGLAVQGVGAGLGGPLGGYFLGEHLAPLPEEAGRARDAQGSRQERTRIRASSIRDSDRLTLVTDHDVLLNAGYLGSGGNIYFDVGGDVLPGYAQERFSRFDYEESIRFDGFTGGYESGRLYAGVEGERSRTEKFRGSATPVGSLIQAAGTVDFQVGGDLLPAGSEIDAAALTGNIEGDFRPTAAEGYEFESHSEVTDTLSLTAGLRNSYLDMALTAGDAVEAARQVREARKALAEARDDPRITDYSDLQANLALATAQATAMGVQTASAISGAFETSVTGGFYSDLVLDVERTEHQGEFRSTTAIESAMTARDGDLTLEAGGDMKGSGVFRAAGDMTLRADNVDLGAIEETYSEESRTEQQSGQVTLASSRMSGFAGAVMMDNLGVLSGGVGKSVSASESGGVTRRNSTLEAGGLLHIDAREDTRIRGADVTAGLLRIDTRDLTLGSVQNTAWHDHSSTGFHTGAGTGGNLNVAADQAEGSGERAWVEDVTWLHGAEGVAIHAEGHSHIEGAVITSDNPQWSYLDTNTFSHGHIHDRDRGESSGWRISGNLNPASIGDQLRSPDGATTVGAEREGHRREGITLATVQDGIDIRVRDGESERNTGLADLNRDPARFQEITRDEITGGLDFDLTVDHRWLSGQGREEIARDLAAAAGLPRDLAEIMREVLGDGSFLDLGELIHRYGLNRKIATEMQQEFPQYDELIEVLAEVTGQTQEDVRASLSEILPVIGGLETGQEELLAEAVASFGLVGDLGHELALQDGSLYKAALHARVGEMLAGEPGRDAAALNETLMPLLLEVSGGSPQRLRALSRIVGGVSSEDAATGAWVAEQGTRYNRQLHQSELVAIRDNARSYAQMHDISESEALTHLLLEGLRQVDAGYSGHISTNPKAAAFLNQLAADNPHMTITSSSGHQGGLFDTSQSDYLNSTVNASHLWDMENILGHPVRNALLDGAGNWMVDSGAITEVYWPVHDSTGDHAASQQFSQLGIPAVGMLSPALVSGGAAGYGYVTTQGQFWGGVASHAGLRAAQSVGAKGYANLNAMGRAVHQSYTHTVFTSNGALLFTNPAVQEGAVDFAEGFFVHGPPPPSVPGYLGFGLGRVIPFELQE